MSKPTAEQPRRLRCAIYTRKSSEEGLDQEYNSLDAQRDAGEAYIASQKHEGWMMVPEFYDDGGFSGGNLERPALKRLLDDTHPKNRERKRKPSAFMISACFCSCFNLSP
jgi:site-specific DNA recombinase